MSEMIFFRKSGKFNSVTRWAGALSYGKPAIVLVCGVHHGNRYLEVRVTELLCYLPKGEGAKSSIANTFFVPAL